MKIYDTLSQAEKNKLNTIKPGQRRIEVEWKTYIDFGKKYVSDMAKAKMKIAECAIKACYKNGKPKGGKYTLVNYADAIGINRSTLTEWVSLKLGIYDKLESKPKEISIETLRTVRKLSKNKIKSTPKEVNRVYKSITVKEDYRKFYKMLLKLKTLHYNTKAKVRMRGADKEQLAEIQYLCREIAFNIEKYLEKK